MTDRPTVALAGNPNCGKTTLFNALTGSRQHVGNWPGKTVERRSGQHVSGELVLEVVDLPGTYSLAASSLDEAVTRDFLVGDEIDAAVIVVDATNAERNLYLAVQILEIGIPAVIAVNMWDSARALGISIDIEALSSALGVVAIPTVARRGTGIAELSAALTEMLAPASA